MITTTRDYRDFRKQQLSESNYGEGILVNATTSPGTLIHTALASSAKNEWDAVTIDAANMSASAVELTLQFAGTGTNDKIIITIPPKSGLQTVLDGLVVNGGREIRAYASANDAIVLYGIVNRYEYSRP